MSWWGGIILVVSILSAFIIFILFIGTKTKQIEISTTEFEKKQLELQHLEELIARRLVEQQRADENYDKSLEALNALESRTADVRNKYDEILGSYNTQITTLNSQISELKAQNDLENTAIKAKKQECDNLVTTISNLHLDLKRLQASHAAAMIELSKEQSDVNECGGTFELNSNEKLLVEVLTKLEFDYPDLAVDLGAIEGKKVWMKKIQDLAKLEDLDGCSGIYRLIEKSTGCIYIGQAVDIKSRWYTHIKKMVGAEAKGSEKIYAARPDAYGWAVVERVSKDQLNEREAGGIDFYASDKVGLNSKSGKKEG